MAKSKTEVLPESVLLSDKEKAYEIIVLNKDKGGKIIRAHILLAELKITDKEVTELLVKAGIGRSTSGWTQTNTLEYLEDGVTEHQLYQKLIDEGAKNEARWVSDRNRIRLVLNKVHAKFENAVVEEAATPAQKEMIKALVKG